MELTGRQKRHLRGLGHSLHPVVMVGREGVTEAVIRKTAIELENHELIKVKAGEGCLENAKEVGEALSAATGAAVAQVIGRIALLYRRRKTDPIIELPKA